MRIAVQSNATVMFSVTEIGISKTFDNIIEHIFKMLKILKIAIHIVKFWTILGLTSRN